MPALCVFAAGYAGADWLLGSLDIRPEVMAVSAAAPEPVLAAVSKERSAAFEAVWPRALFERLPIEVSADPTRFDEAERPSGRKIDSRAAAHGSTRLLDVVGTGALDGPFSFETTLDEALMRAIRTRLHKARARRAHVIVLDPRSGRVLAWVATDESALPAGRAYPAASLVKIVTAAAALERAPERAAQPCVYRGSPYRLSRSRVHSSRFGRRASLEVALATSNNQCLAQLAVEVVGAPTLAATLRRFGWLEAPVAGSSPGEVAHSDPGDDYALGRLGCGLSGSRITPLHAAQLAAVLADGELVTPWWIERVRDRSGRELELAPPSPPRRVISGRLARELRTMLVRTTTRGTARRAFRGSHGRPKLGSIRVAGKTGNLSGDNPRGRYEWFIGLAPAEQPSIAVAVLQLQSDLWWAHSSEIGADVLTDIFCEHGHCDVGRSSRLTRTLDGAVRPAMVSASTR